MPGKTTSHHGKKLAKFNRKEDDFDTFHLMEDQYAVAFVSYMKEIDEKFDITPQMVSRQLYGCLWIFLIELTIVALIFKSIVGDVENFKI